MTVDRNLVAANLHTPRHQALFLAATSNHSGDWLTTLPIASCGLLLDDEAIRVAVALRLGLDVCVPHVCRCGKDVDAGGVHAFTCKKSQGKIARHRALNDVIARAFVAADVPVTKEPTGLSRSDGKRPDGLTLVPWKCGKALTWDVTVAATLAESYIRSTSVTAGSAAEAAALKKCAKYGNLPANYLFQPIALETQGFINSSAAKLLQDVGRKISAVSGEAKETLFLFQRVSMVLQRYNSIILHDSFETHDDRDL